MPGTPLDQNNSNGVSNGLQAEDPQRDDQQQQQQQQQQQPAAGAPAREITQTDKLNKRLLVSFLNRMNSQTDNDQQSSNDKSEDEADNDTSFE